MMSDPDTGHSAAPNEELDAFSEALEEVTKQVKEQIEAERGKPTKAARVVVGIWVCVVAITYSYYRFFWDPHPVPQLCLRFLKLVQLLQYELHRNTLPAKADGHSGLPTEPANTIVRLIQWPEAYRDGILLPAGWYRIVVSAPGYLTELVTVRHDYQSPIPHITLVASTEYSAETEAPL